jgi:uncharacterized membrane protein
VDDKNVSLQDRIADGITAFSGSMLFVWIHVIVFGGWIVYNMSPAAFDPFPFGLLTMWVSLEAIFLATFVLISQNRQGQAADKRAELDYKINIKAEHEVEAIQAKLTEILTKLNKK